MSDFAVQVNPVGRSMAFGGLGAVVAGGLDYGFRTGWTWLHQTDSSASDQPSLPSWLPFQPIDEAEKAEMIKEGLIFFVSGHCLC